MAIIAVAVLDGLAFFDDGIPWEVAGVAGDVFHCHDAASLRNLRGDPAGLLAFRGTASLSGDQSRAVTQTLAFAQAAARARVGYVYQNLAIAQSAGSGRALAGDGQTLTFAETAVGVATRVGADALGFTETPALGATRARPGGDTLAFAEGATVYSPAASFSAVPPPAAPPPPPPAPAVALLVAPPLAPTATVTLTTKGGTIVLPAPEFGDVEDLGQTRIARNARGGTFIVFRDPAWPTTDAFTLAFRYLSEAQADALRVVVAGGVGLLSTYVDYEGTSWQVIVTSPDLVVTQTGRFNYTAALTLLVAS